MQIPIAKPFIGEEEKQAVVQVLSSGQLSQGPKVAEFEKVLTRWDDPSPTGCRPLANYGMISAHWSGGIQCGVPDPDGPQKRRDMRGWLLFGHRIYNAS